MALHIIDTRLSIETSVVLTTAPLPIYGPQGLWWDGVVRGSGVGTICGIFFGRATFLKGFQGPMGLWMGGAVNTLPPGSIKGRGCRGPGTIEGSPGFSSVETTEVSNLQGLETTDWPRDCLSLL